MAILVLEKLPTYAVRSFLEPWGSRRLLHGHIRHAILGAHNSIAKLHNQFITIGSKNINLNKHRRD